ncbi:LOW QUALITY PROTEIN: streptococcal hemagglutinin [Drosophila sulfurigaster albostrigata]|uniref:LOW QUALITY PROTEIN: streptococcal hemagglutinin n=1 Tax=Drosophila sulfurigaster albostrigata TaxID=89887 RepID=UPI002D219967|nr:LOW QUALITY PROTEIN: streptococcal hemagglutinin [Drosophila sulfurigaster albostrigata]
MLSAELTSSALLNASYQRTNGLTKDEACLSTTFGKCRATTEAAAATTAAATTTPTTTAAAAAMTKQLTTTTATNAASSITQAANLAPTVISPTTTVATPTIAAASTTATTTTITEGALTATITTTTETTKTQSQAQPTIATKTTSATKAASTTSTATTASASASASASSDASGRSAALERAYVHDVYEHCEEPTRPPRPRVAQFLGNLEPGSVVCDVGCGSGRYLTQCNPAICTIGIDRCYRLSKAAHEKGGEVALCDNLELPFRDDSFDAVLSLAVVHHFATTERRVRALRELARILRIGGRVVITVWALEQRHRRFESQDVLIPWQPPKNRTYSYSYSDEDDDDYLPPYHAYTEDSTNSSRSAGDGDSSSLSSSSPGESCYSFVRRALQKLAGGRRHAWFLDSWASKETRNDSSLDYEDAKDLPIELRRLEDFEDFPDPPLSAGLKSRSLGSILQTPPRQIVRSRSSVPSLGGPLVPCETKASASAALLLNAPETQLNGRHSPTPTSTGSAGSTLSRRPKLIKQKQSLCDDDNSSIQEPPSVPTTNANAPFQMLSSYNSASGAVSSSLYTHNSPQPGSSTASPPTGIEASESPAAPTTNLSGSLRKQSSLNEELMAGNRLREKERVRKRIQKQTSLNEAFLCRSALFSKRLQMIRDGFTTKIKSSTGSLERVTKTGITKLMQNIKNAPATQGQPATPQQQQQQQGNNNNKQQQLASPASHTQPHQHYHHHHHLSSNAGSLFPAHLLLSSTSSGPVSYCSIVDCSAANICQCSAYQQECVACADSEQGNARRHSRESGSDSSKDSSLQSDTSIESEDSFASVIFIPKPEQHQQQLNYQQQHQNSSSSNSSSSNGAAAAQAALAAGATATIATNNTTTATVRLLPTNSVPTSPLIMPCPPTPAHSPAAIQGTVTSPPQSTAAVTAAMAMLTPAAKPARFSFDEAHIKEQREQQQPTAATLAATTIAAVAATTSVTTTRTATATTTATPTAAAITVVTTAAPMAAHKITRQTIREMPPIPKFRKQQSLQLQRPSFPIVRRASGSGMAGSSSKLLSLELFNPATDDLDSDSSEPSSPDSIDSVISAPRSAQLLSAPSTEAGGKSSDESDTALAQFRGELHINNATTNGNDIILNADSAPLLPEKRETSQAQRPLDCNEFAEKLTAQLQRELDDKCNRAECRSLDGIGDIGEFLNGGRSSKKRSNGDLSALRDELRERRLMLANLSTQHSLQQSPVSSSTSSLSSQTRSFTIHEEQEGEEEDEENERSYTLGIYEHCKVSKFNYKRNRNYNLNAETAYLLQEDGDSDQRDDDDHIREEDEDAEALEARGGDQLGAGMHEYGQRRRNLGSIKSMTSSGSSSTETVSTTSQPPQSLQQRASIESLEHSNSSTASLDSPSQGGGATTHHRFYHVFREGELDALINHHVASLHIVSSYYERASWCVVAEKVQVWTI